VIWTRSGCEHVSTVASTVVNLSQNTLGEGPAQGSSRSSPQANRLLLRIRSGTIFERKDALRRSRGTCLARLTQEH